MHYFPLKRETRGSGQWSNLKKAIIGELVGLRVKLKFIWIQMLHSFIAPTWPKRDLAQGQERMRLPKAEPLGFSWAVGYRKSQEKTFNQAGAESHGPLSFRAPVWGVSALD